MTQGVFLLAFTALKNDCSFLRPLEPESEESEETKKLKEDFDKQYKNDNVEFIEPDYDTWQDQEPGTVVKKNQEEREKALETEGF